MGCTKYGVKPYDHGIVYDKDSQPEVLKGEPALAFSPICFEPSLHERIGKGARVDYGNLTVVEHNAKVSFIGRIVTEDWQGVPDAVDTCLAKNKAQGSNNHEHQGDDKKSDRGTIGREPAPSFIGSGSTLVSPYSSPRRDSNLYRGPKVHWPVVRGTEVPGSNDQNLTGSVWSKDFPTFRDEKPAVKDPEGLAGFSPGPAQVNR